MSNKTFAIAVSGRVQGVGFRPFIYNLAKNYNIKGFVTNDQLGVFILAQGKPKEVDLFENAIRLQKPPGAIILSIEKIETENNEVFTNFFIRKTANNIKIDLPLTPDFALCKNCSTELLDPANRRFYYSFTSCTHCGPRYAVTNKFPFERENNEFSKFEMCLECNEEYETSTDIRFHSQTNSCPNCGIKLKFTDNSGQVLSTESQTIFGMISEKLKTGKIIALKNTAGYLLVCDATNAKAVQELRNKKKRPSKPFAVLFKNIDVVKKYLAVNENHKKALESAESPIVILKLLEAGNLATNEIAPNMKTIGAMLPNSGTLMLLAENFDHPIIATSGNFHGSPICSTEEESIEKLKNITDYFLHNDLKINYAQDDSVVKFSEKHKQKIILRRSRGLAPNFMDFKTNRHDKVLCLGSDLKSTISILPNSNCYVSQYIGNLSNFETLLRFENTIDEYFKLFDFEPEFVLCDAHPGYESSKFSAKYKDILAAKIKSIQHHKAHFASILGEKNLWESDDKVLGIIWDGIGFGTEIEIWGGEFFGYHKNKIEKIGHLDFFPWILGDKMSREPRISALAVSDCNSLFRNYFDDNEWNIYSKIIKNPVVKTSSVGRLFDAVAFVLGFRGNIGFEGESAMYLEQLAQDCFSSEPNKFENYLGNINCDGNIIPVKKLFERIISEQEKNTGIGIIALNFHFTMIKCIEEIARNNGFKKLCFSGGVFQNSVLIDLIIDLLSKDFELHFHENLSPNDENISFGQLNYFSNMIMQQ